MPLTLKPEASANLAQKKEEQALLELANRNNEIIAEFDPDGSIGLRTFVELGFRLDRADRPNNLEHYSWVATNRSTENKVTFRANRTPVMKYTRFAALATLNDGEKMEIVLRSPVATYDMDATKRTYDKLFEMFLLAMS